MRGYTLLQFVYVSHNSNCRLNCTDQWRSHWGRGARGAMPPPPPFPRLQFLYETRFNCLSFKHQGYFSLWVFRNYTDQKFHNYYRVCYKFGKIYGSFSIFSNYIGEIDHFTLDLLKRSDT